MMGGVVMKTKRGHFGELAWAVESRRLRVGD